MKDDRTITEIKSRAASLVPLLVDLSRYKKDGGSHVRGPCPWKPTSDGLAFRLDMQTGGWAYFVEAQGEDGGTGDILSLVQNIRALDFPAAKLWAAEKLGIQVENNGRAGGQYHVTSHHVISSSNPDAPTPKQVTTTGTPAGPKPPPEPDGPAMAFLTSGIASRRA